jgi:uncharacterized protein (DUF362 family)
MTNRLRNSIIIRGLKKSASAIHPLILGLACIVWLLFRSGLKPSRVAYPCQKAAAAYSTSYFAWLLFPASVRLPKYIAPLSVLFLVALGAYGLFATPAETILWGHNRTNAMMESFATEMKFNQKLAVVGANRASDVFVIDNIPPATGGYDQPHKGVDALIQLMGENGNKFYKSGKAGIDFGPEGIIGRGDVVLIKVNRASPNYASTNLDVVQGLVYRIIHHPDGFGGEVVIVENAQGSNLGRPEMPNANSDNSSHTYGGLVDYWNKISRVSYNVLDDVNNSLVDEFEHDRDGYYMVPSQYIAYPKFTTAYGTKIDLKYGVWNGTGYDDSGLKMINVPVLKNHRNFGATASLKNYVGLACNTCLGINEDIHSRITDYPLNEGGILGRYRTYIRNADLDVIDAINVIYCGGPFDKLPNGDSSWFIRTDVLFAGEDPVALDYYAIKHLLYPIIPEGVDCGYGDDTKERADPDNMNASITSLGWPVNSLHQYLTLSAIELNKNGIFATMDEGRMNVYARDFLRNQSI